jgi:diacylglycerol kinase family enzyme
MKHVFIIDPVAFNNQQWRMDGLLDSIGQYFRTQEKPNFSTLFSHYPRDAMGLIQKQMDEGDEFEEVRVYAIGGDDILFDCLNGIAELPRTELAIMPYGDTNNFIRSFGEGKAEGFKDIPTITEAPTISTDVIKVGNNYAINGCSVGLTPAVTTKMKEIESKLERGLNSFSRFFLLLLNNLTSLFDKDITAHQYKITIDDNDYSGKYSLINIVNGPYFGRSKHALEGVMPDDGFLDVILFKSAAPLLALNAIRKYSHGKKLPSSCVRIKAQKIEIKSDSPMWIQTDSEFLQDTSITFNVIPGEVQVVAVHDLTYQGT